MNHCKIPISLRPWNYRSLHKQDAPVSLEVGCQGDMTDFVSIAAKGRSSLGGLVWAWLKALQLAIPDIDAVVFPVILQMKVQAVSDISTQGWYVGILRLECGDLTPAFRNAGRLA
jgi:hypothetical protein